jgi:hypothetical protein
MLLSHKDIKHKINKLNSINNRICNEICYETIEKLKDI